MSAGLGAGGTDGPGRTYLVDGPVGVSDGWWVDEDGHDPARVVALASAHLTGNGALAYRGTCAGWGADATVGCIVHDTWDTAPGSAWTELCTVPDALWARWSTSDGAPLLLAHDQPQPDDAAFTRDLDVRHVEQHHHLLLERAGGDLELRERRFASLADRHLIVQQQRVTAPPGTRLLLETRIEGEVWSLNGTHLHDHAAESVDDLLVVSAVTGERGLPVAVAQSLTLADDRGATVVTDVASIDLDDALRPRRRIELTVGPTGHVVATQCMAVVTGHDLVEPPTDPSPTVRARTRSARPSGPPRSRTPVMPASAGTPTCTRSMRPHGRGSGTTSTCASTATRSRASCCASTSRTR